jgi:hypothetical protein
VVSRRDIQMTLSRGYLRSVRREVRMVMVDVWGVPVRIMTTGRTSTAPSGCGERWLEGCIFHGHVARCEICYWMCTTLHFHSLI